MNLHEYEKRILFALREKQSAGAAELEKLAGLDSASINRASLWLQEKGLAEIKESKTETFVLGKEGKGYLERGLPERRVLDAGEKSISELEKLLGKDVYKIGINWLVRDGIARIDAGKLTVLRKEYLADVLPRETALMLLGAGKPLPPELVPQLELLRKRGRIVELVTRTDRTIGLTPKGSEAAKTVKVEKEINVLTPELIKSGKWEGAKLRRYDIGAPSEKRYPGKKHPLRIVIDRIRGIFAEMGFREIKGPVVESAFWNFDALFVPQDHPGREMQDTFYLESKTRELPKGLVPAVKRAHEEKWGYKWEPELAKETVLRTHTTAVTCRELAKSKEFPVKVFCVDRVFRNEAIDYKHLAEFHQVEGIIIDEKATLLDLLGVLKEFYERLGFRKIRFRPAYFPYTEPSLEVEVFYEKKNMWMEFGGAGIFRKEVTGPLGVKANVLAWGLSLERPIMLLQGLEDIRTFYRNDLGWIRGEEAAPSAPGKRGRMVKMEKAIDGEP